VTKVLKQNKFVWCFQHDHPDSAFFAFLLIWPTHVADLFYFFSFNFYLTYKHTVGECYHCGLIRKWVLRVHVALYFCGLFSGGGWLSSAGLVIAVSAMPVGNANAAVSYCRA